MVTRRRVSEVGRFVVLFPAIVLMCVVIGLEKAAAFFESFGNQRQWVQDLVDVANRIEAWGYRRR